jgi:hypothetical protein
VAAQLYRETGRYPAFREAGAGRQAQQACRTPGHSPLNWCFTWGFTRIHRRALRNLRDRRLRLRKRI